ncbi:MAG: hypothetical protein ABJM26_18120 [Anderseniella sp.]
MWIAFAINCAEVLIILHVLNGFIHRFGKPIGHDYRLAAREAERQLTSNQPEPEQPEGCGADQIAE